MKAQAINTDYPLKTLLIGKTIYPNGSKQISVHTNEEWYGIGNTKTEKDGATRVHNNRPFNAVGIIRD